MATINLKETNHIFQKSNLVSDKNGNDTYVCKLCGMKATRRGFSEEIFSKKYTDKQLSNCPKADNNFLSRKIIITNCTARGAVFANITPNSIHSTVPSPEGKESGRGYWVMGVGEPVLVLGSECKLLPNDDFETPVMDDRLVRLNEMKAVKMSSISSSKRPLAKENKELARYIIENWDNLAELQKINVKDVKDVDVVCILSSRIQNFLDAKRECEKIEEEFNMIYGETEESNKKIELVDNMSKSVKKLEKNIKKTKKVFNKILSKEKTSTKTSGHKVGDLHKNGLWVWTEYAEGKFDWRTIPSLKKNHNSVSTKTVKKEVKKETKKAEKPSKKEVVMSLEEFTEHVKKNKNVRLSDTQKKYLKQIITGSHVENNFFVNTKGENQMQVVAEALESLLAKYNVNKVIGLK